MYAAIASLADAENVVPFRQHSMDTVVADSSAVVVLSLQGSLETRNAVGKLRVVSRELLLINELAQSIKLTFDKYGFNE